MFTGAFAQLNIALCGSPNDPGARSSNWYCRQAAGCCPLQGCAPNLPSMLQGDGCYPVSLLLACQSCALTLNCLWIFFTRSDDRWATFLRNTITSLAPSLILSIYHM